MDNIPITGRIEPFLVRCSYGLVVLGQLITMESHLYGSFSRVEEGLMMGKRLEVVCMICLKLCDKGQMCELFSQCPG